jgi:hypothetical protein
MARRAAFSRLRERAGASPAPDCGTRRATGTAAPVLIDGPPRPAVVSQAASQSEDRRASSARSGLRAGSDPATIGIP